MVSQSVFIGENGLDEHFFAMTSTPGGNFREQAEALLKSYREAAAGTVPVWIRFHVSDVANQASELRRILGEVTAVVSIVGQPPADGAKLAVEAYHLTPGPALVRTGSLLEARLRNYELLFFHQESLPENGSGPQMRVEFEEAERILVAHGGSVADNLQRTWIYCRDIDNNYADLVAARRELFRTRGLTAGSHYIASTGIEGLDESSGRLVRMDSFALFGHVPEQVEYLHAPEHLSPTHIYGVTFERGTRIVYADRSSYYISGTASIDREGKIVHPGDVARQTQRLLENVAALLTNHGGALGDLKQAVVYLRDLADREIVETVLAEYLAPETAGIIVKGAVCRPGWLVELDGIAVNRRGNRRFMEFA